MTLEQQALRCAAAYERTILHAQSPGEVAQLRQEIGEVVELLRTVAARALAFEDALKASEDDRRYRLALETAGDPHASWPPPLHIVKLQAGERQ